jgi:predicted amidophosphoribosyltransferase
MTSSGYIHCAHLYCFAILIGKPGDLCSDCREASGDASDHECEGCDNDRDVSCDRCGALFTSKNGPYLECDCGRKLPPNLQAEGSES